MHIEIKRSFNKDIEGIKDKKILKAVLAIIQNIEKAISIRELKNVVKIKGSKNHYRIRLGDYRLGLLIENKTVVMVRFLHRKEIYKYFS